MAPRPLLVLIHDPKVLFLIFLTFKHTKSWCQILGQLQRICSYFNSSNFANEPQRPQADQKLPDQEPIKYGNVFNVSSQLASKPITPRDAAVAQAAENKVLGQTPIGSSASVTESAAAKNEQAGLVGYRNATYIGREEGFKMSEIYVDGNRIITEAVGGQVVGHIVEPEVARRFTGAVLVDKEPITIGEALEACLL